MSKIIRVFARKTSFTPEDDVAFYDEPPLFDLPDMPVFVSVTFTWDIERGKTLAAAWKGKAGNVHLGGPAFGHPGSEFTPGLFLKEGITITSRGCPKKCPWCLVPGREGKIKELAVRPGYIVQDNNILACSPPHFVRVCQMLAWQKRAAQFKGGLDIDFLTEWHVEQLKKIRVSELWVACDSAEDLDRLDKAADLLSDFSIEHKRCYVLIGFRGENIASAERRLEAVYAKGFLPFAQLFEAATQHSKPKFTWPQQWRDLARKWSRPAAYRGTK